MFSTGPIITLDILEFYKDVGKLKENCHYIWQNMALVNALLPGLKIDGMPIDLDIDLKTLRTQPASAAAIIGAGSGGGAMAVDAEPAGSDAAGASLLGQALFAKLISVCTSTQTAAVAHKSLRALNKIVALMPTADFTQLPFDKVSRFIGDLLVSVDLITLSGALCMAELLMSNFPGKTR